MIEIADDDSDQLRLRASLGWEDGPPEGVNSLDDVARLCDPAYEVEGCYLWPADEAMAAGRPAGAAATSHAATASGPLAWDHHWLIVPLRHADGRIGGWVWPDDPADHLLPTPEKLRILRTFANQALAAVSDAAHVDQLKALARVDELTGVLNRRAFFERLDHELHRARRGQGARVARDVRPRPVQGAQRRPRPSGRRRRAPQLHQDPRAERPGLRRGRARRRRRVRARSSWAPTPATWRASSSGSRPPSRPTRRRSATCARATAWPARPDDGWTRERARRSRRPPPLRPQAPPPDPHPRPRRRLSVNPVELRVLLLVDHAGAGRDTTSAPPRRCRRRAWCSGGRVEVERRSRTAPHCARSRSAPASSAPLAVST